MADNHPIPTYLYHYYEASCGPFLSLSDLPPQEAETIQERIRQEGNRFASRRAQEYLQIRREIEQKIRSLFIGKGGKPERLTPHYFVLGECTWLQEWYVDGRAVWLPLAAFPSGSLSFTYGDSFPAMRYQDGRPYRGQVYTTEDLPVLIEQYGLPQVWNPDGKLAPERYIEAQVWEDRTINLALCQTRRPIKVN